MRHKFGTKQYFYLAVYVAGFIFSAIATGSSLTNSYIGIPTYWAYMMGLLFIGMASLGVTAIFIAFDGDKNYSAPMRNFFLIGGMILLFGGWACSFATNTHQLYLWSNLGTLKKENLRDVYLNLQRIPTRGSQVFDVEISDANSSVTQLIKNLKDEILDETNYGYQEKAQGEMNKIKQRLFLANDIQIPAFPKGTKLSVRDWIPFSNELGRRSEQALAVHIHRINQEKDEFATNIETEQYKNIIPRLDSIIRFYPTVTNEDINITLEESHALYEAIYKDVEQIMSKDYLQRAYQKSEIIPLPKVPEALKLKDIFYSWIALFKGKLYSKASFIFSMVFAFFLDLGCLAFYYFAVFFREDKY